MANVFKEGKMVSNNVDSYLANAKNASEEMIDGGLVVLGALVADTTYSAGGVEYDTYAASKPAAATDEIAIIDYAGISSGNIAGNNYKLGVKLYGLSVPKGEITRVRRLALHDKFWLGADNFASTPVVGEYAIATASSYQHTPNATKAASGYCIKVLLSEDLTAGMKSEGKLYLCEVVGL